MARPLPSANSVFGASSYDGTSLGIPGLASPRVGLPLFAEFVMDLSTILIQVISGAVGGNLAGFLNKAKSLGPLLNTILGAVGGVGGGQLLGGQLTDLLGNATAGTATASGLVGLVLPLVAGLLKKKAA